VISLTSASDSLPLSAPSAPGERRADFADTVLRARIERAAGVRGQMKRRRRDRQRALRSHLLGVGGAQHDSREAQERNLRPVMSPLRLDGRDVAENPLPLLLLLASEVKLSPPAGSWSAFFRIPAGCAAVGGVVGGDARPKLAPRPATELLSPPIQPSATPD